MFLLLEDGHYDLLNFVTRKSYWCYIKDGIKMKRTTMFSKEEQNYIWNVPPIYIIYLMFVTCFFPKLIDQANVTEFIQNIDLFKDDYIIFGNVYDKIKNDKGDDKKLSVDIENIEKEENRLKIQIELLRIKLQKIDEEYKQEYNKYFKTIQDKYLNEIIAGNLENENNINSDFKKIANNGNINKNNDFFNNYSINKYPEDYFINEIDKFQHYIDNIDGTRDEENKYKRRHEIPNKIENFVYQVNELNLMKKKLITDKDSINFTKKTFIDTYNLMNDTDLNPEKINNIMNEIKNKIKSEHIDKTKVADVPEDGDGTGDGKGDGDDTGRGAYSYKKTSSIKIEKGIKDEDNIKEPPPPEGPPPPQDELDMLNDTLKEKIIGAWKEVNYDKDPTKKYWWNEITNETTSIGASKPTGLTGTTPKKGFMSYDNPLKENSKTSFIVFVNLVLYPGKSIPDREKRRLACYVNYEEIRRSYAELWDYEYIPIPMNEDEYYNLVNKNDKSTNTMNNTRRVTFDNRSPQRIQGGKNKTKRNR